MSQLAPQMTPKILWQDEFFAVLQKPAGLVVNVADSVRSATLQEWARAEWGSATEWQESLKDPIFAEREGMVHRLDKDTSGVIVWAKTARALHSLLGQFRERTVQKTYLALVHGRLPQSTGVVRAAIERNPQNRIKFTVTNQGRESETEFTVRHEFDALTPAQLRDISGQKDFSLGTLANTARNLYAGGFSLVELQPKTGRTHQIRVHMDYLHHPLVGDERYAGRKRYRLDAVWCPRQWLHAWKISLIHPESGFEQSFSAPLPADLQAALEILKPELSDTFFTSDSGNSGSTQ